MAILTRQMYKFPRNQLYDVCYYFLGKRIFVLVAGNQCVCLLDPELELLTVVKETYCDVACEGDGMHI